MAGYASGQTSVKVYDGTTLSLGDTIRIGQKGRNRNGYHGIKESVKTEYGTYYEDVTADLALRRAVVVGCKPQEADKIFFDGRPVIVALAEGYPKKLYINIDPAIERGEIAWVYRDHAVEQAVELTREMMLACCIRSNQLPVTDYVLQYLINVKDPELYRACMSDEFKYHRAKPEYEKMLREMMDSFDFSKTYYIRTNLSIGKYDFEKYGYPVDFYGNTSRYFIPYGDFNFLPTNREKFGFVPVSPENGEKANVRRKGVSSFGYIPSLAYGRVYLKLLDKRMTLPKNSILNMEGLYRQSVIGATIEKMEVYDFENCDYNLIGTIE